VTAAAVQPAAAAHAPLRAPVLLRYHGIGPFAGRGARTGRLYLCPGSGATLQVEQADLDALIRTKRFRRL
jgi:hypothetical protein